MSQLSFFTSLPPCLRLSTWIWSHWCPGSRCQRTAGRCWCRTRGSPSWGWRRTRPRVLTSGSPPRSASAGDHLALIWNRERNFKRQGNSRNSKKNLFMDIKFKSFFSLKNWTWITYKQNFRPVFLSRWVVLLQKTADVRQTSPASLGQAWSGGRSRTASSPSRPHLELDLYFLLQLIIRSRY